MSAAPRIIEGTWEEVAKHGPELAGRHVKLVIVEDASESAPAALSAEQWVKWLYEWAYNRRPVGPWDDSRETIYEDLLK